MILLPFIIIILILWFSGSPETPEDKFILLRNIPNHSTETWLSLRKTLKDYIPDHRINVNIVVIRKSLDRSYELDYIIYDNEGLRGHTKLNQFISLSNITDESMESLREHIIDSNPFIPLQ